MARDHDIARYLAAGLMLLALLSAVPAAADDWAIRKYYNVQRPATPGLEPVFRSGIEGEAWTGFFSGFTAATVPLRDHDTEFDFYFGIRPSLLGFDMDISYNQRFNDIAGSCCSTVEFDFDRPLWRGAALAGSFSLDPETNLTRTETRATFRVFENYQLDSTLKTSFHADNPGEDTLVNYNLFASRNFIHDDGANTRIGIRFADTNRAAATAALSVSYHADF